MFGFGKKKEARSTIVNFTITAPVLFHKECNGIAEHGKLEATHATLGVGKNDGVRFAFDGIDPPHMTPEVLAYIWDQAERKGYVVNRLHSYVNVMNLAPAPVLFPRDTTPAPVLPMGAARTDHRPLARTPRKPSHERGHAQPA